MALIITTAEVAAILALSLNDADVLQAQAIIELVTGADLTTVNPELRYSEADIYALRTAVLWEVSYLQAHPEAINQASNIASASANGTSVTFNTAATDGYLSPLSARVLARLSWAPGAVTVSTLRPNPTYDQTPPSAWVRIN